MPSGITKTKEELLELLEETNPFGKGAVSDVQLERLAERVEYRSYKKDEYICKRREPTKAAFYLVLGGTFWFQRDPADFIRSTTMLNAGDHFGEELLSAAEFRTTTGKYHLEVSAPYSVWAGGRGVAEEECRCAVLTVSACRDAMFNIDEADKLLLKNVKLSESFNKSFGNMFNNSCSAVEKSPDRVVRAIKSTSSARSKFEKQIAQNQQQQLKNKPMAFDSLLKSPGKPTLDNGAGDFDIDMLLEPDDEECAARKFKEISTPKVSKSKLKGLATPKSSSKKKLTDKLKDMSTPKSSKVKLKKDTSAPKSSKKSKKKKVCDDASVLASMKKVNNYVSKGKSKDKDHLGEARSRPPGEIFQEKLELDVSNRRIPVHPKTKEEKQTIERAMRDRALLKHVPDGTIDHLTDAFEKSKVKAGKEIVKQGSQDSFYYVVSKGECEYEIDGIRHPNLTHKAGESFGEDQLITRTPRGASIHATTDMELFRVDQTTYRILCQQDVQDDRLHKLDLLRKVDFLHNVSDENKEKLASLLEARKFKKGELISRKEESGQTFRIVDGGEIACCDVSNLVADKADLKLGSGQYFGQQALMKVHNPVKADLMGSKPGTLYQIDPDKYQQVIGSSVDLIPVEDRTLGGILALQREPGEYLSHSDTMKLSRCIHNKPYRKGAVIVEQDVEMEAAIYILREGNAWSNKGGTKGGRKGRMLTLLTPGSHFGEELFIEVRKVNQVAGPSPYQLTAKSNCVVGILSIHDYYNAMDLEHLVDTPPVSDSPTIKPKKKLESTPKLPKWPKCDIALPDLERLSILGQGTFGQVWLVSDKKKKRLRGKPCVVKIQSKYHLVSSGEAQVCIEEKHIMQKLHHPFIVDLVNAYQDEGFVYLMMEFIHGGEMYSLLNPWEREIFPESQAKFYALAIADAFAYIHSKKMVFRDLKPENVLIDRYGYPKLIDFGFAKYVEDMTFTLCGTPGYIAPEVVLNKGHGFSYDHWQLGVLIYEMISYESPYFEEDMDQMELHRTVVEDPVPEIEEPISPEVWDLILRLLEKDPTQRLGSLSRGERDISHHSWFKGLSLSKLRKRNIKAPWTPDVKDPNDTSHFDDWEDLEDITMRNDPKLTEEQARMFDDF